MCNHTHQSTPPTHTHEWGAQSQKTATEPAPSQQCCWCIPIWPLGKDQEAQGWSSASDTNPWTTAVSKGEAGRNPDARLGSCTELCCCCRSPVPQPCTRCWELAQTCPVGPQLIRPSLVPDLQGKLYMPESSCHFCSPM